MGGDTVSVLNSSIDDDDDISIGEIPTLWAGGVSGEMVGENESVIGESYARSFRDCYKTLEFEANEKRKNRVYTQLIKNYDDLKDRVETMELAKSKILSYTPGLWVENVGGMTMSDYNVPKTTTLLLIGPKGSGKSSLVNRISRVFEDDKFAPERAQVTYNSSTGDGTCFLQEYMIPRNSTSFCFYDTPGFSNDLSENLEMIKQWMTKGVRHGELAKSVSGSSNLRPRIKCKIHQDKRLTYKRRVDFVIFVANGLSVLKYVEGGGVDTQYMHMVEVFSSPFLSFKDHKPVIAITHGDLLSISERARVRVYLGDLLGVHPCKQIFDIPDNCEPRTELTIIDLVRYALEHADRNLPCKSRPTISKGSSILLWTHLLLLLAVGIFMFTAHLNGFRYLKLNPECVAEPNLKVMKFDQEIIPETDREIKKITELNPEIVPVPSPEIKKVMEFDQEIVPEPDLEIKKVTELNPEIVPVPSLEIKKVMEFDQEIVPEPDLEIKKVTELNPEIVPVPSLEIKKVMEFDQGIVPEADPERKENREFDHQIVPEPDLEIKKVMGYDQETVPERDLETEKVTEIDESDLEIKKGAEIYPGIDSEHILEMKKVIAGSIPKPSKKTKKGDAEKSPGKNKKMKKVRVPEPILEIDWKTIRHIW